VALSPVSYLTKQTSLLLSAARKFRLGVILGKAYPYDVFSWSELPTLGSWLRDFEPYTDICRVKNLYSVLENPF
jgi:hypothetical protein